MNRGLVFVALLVLSTSGSHSSLADEAAKRDTGSQTVTIPLERIWAEYMPGTRDILTLEPEVFSSEASRQPPDVQARRARDSMINQIARKSEPGPVEKDGPAIMPRPRPAFAVLGTGRKALEAAARVFAQNQKPRQLFPAGREISVIFFSYRGGSRVQLVKVEREGQTIRIHYRFFDDGLMASTSHLALIPLGKLPVGKYEVEIVQSPMGSRFRQAAGQIMKDWGDRLVCQPFSFSVTAQQAN
jgi:hypothetical protein